MRATLRSSVNVANLEKSRHRLASLRLLISVAILVGLLLPYLQQPVSIRTLEINDSTSNYRKLVTAKETADAVMPTGGFRTKIVLGNVIPKMVAAGVIDMTKMEALYQKTGMPVDEMKILTQSSEDPLVVNSDNAQLLVNILWPIGLTNHMAVNNQSPIAGKYINNFASTGGWNLGKEETGGRYFNKYNFISLTPNQEGRVLAIAQSSYRPCCNNSTFFQDCNHGSAALALIELGVAQGLSDQEIYRTLVEFNSFWFPDKYIEAAVYLKTVENTQWKKANPKLVISSNYSSLSGYTNLHTIASAQLPDPSISQLSLLPVGRTLCSTGNPQPCANGRCGTQISCSGCSGCVAGGCLA